MRARQEELQHRYCDDLWIGYNVIFPNVFGALALMLAKWYTGDNPLILQDLISGNPKQTLQQVETYEQFELSEQIRSSAARTARGVRGGQRRRHLLHGARGQ